MTPEAEIVLHNLRVIEAVNEAMGLPGGINIEDNPEPGGPSQQELDEDEDKRRRFWDLAKRADEIPKTNTISGLMKLVESDPEAVGCLQVRTDAFSLDREPFDNSSWEGWSGEAILSVALLFSSGNADDGTPSADAIKQHFAPLEKYGLYVTESRDAANYRLDAAASAEENRRQLEAAFRADGKCGSALKSAVEEAVENDSHRADDDGGSLHWYATLVLAEPADNNENDEWPCSAPVYKAFLSLLTMPGVENGIDEYGYNASGGGSLRLRQPYFPQDKSPEEIVATARTQAEIIQLAKEWEQAGRRPRLFSGMGKHAPCETTRFLVDGVLPLGHIVELVGASGVGKSTLVHELAVAVGTNRLKEQLGLTWLGQEVTEEKPGGMVALITGEDSSSGIQDRGSKLDPNGEAARLLSIGGDAGAFQEIVGELRSIPDLALVIVDPARTFAEGDENSSEKVSHFFDILRQLAAEKDCTVLVVHHTGKGRSPKSLDDILGKMRGSGVYRDRPRVILGMYRTGRGRLQTWVGLAKWNLLQEQRAFDGARRLDFDPDTLRHLVVSGEMDAEPAAGEPSRSADGEVQDRVVDAVRQYTRDGIEITQTGRRSLFAHSRRHTPSEIGDLTRDRLHNIQESLIAGGRLMIRDGLITAPQA